MTVLRFLLFLPLIFASGSKKGLDISRWDFCLTDLAATGSVWYSDWYPQTPMQACPQFEGVPMVDRAENLLIEVIGNSPWLAGFNEPDQSGQANLSPETAAVLWRLIEMAHPDKLLLSPAPSDQHPEWLAQFRQAYIARYGDEPRLNAIAVHCYLSELQCESYVQQRIDEAHQWGIERVWVTEFAFVNSADLARFGHWLESNPAVARYAVYTARATRTEDAAIALFDSTGHLTEMGQIYRSLP